MFDSGKNLCPSYSQSAPQTSSTQPSALAGTLEVCIAEQVTIKFTAKTITKASLIVTQNTSTQLTDSIKNAKNLFQLKLCAGDISLHENM